MRVEHFKGNAEYGRIYQVTDRHIGLYYGDVLVTLSLWVCQCISLGSVTDKVAVRVNKCIRHKNQNRSHMCAH